MSVIESYFDGLLARVCELEDRFIQPFLPVDPLLPPSAYELDVRAYCVLCHAALEEFVEKVVMYMMTEAVDGWLATRDVTDTLLTLVGYYRLEITIEEEEDQPQARVFDLLRKMLAKAKKNFSGEVSINHGVSLKYLRKLLIPVALDVPDNAIWLNSLAQLAKERGAYAHSGQLSKVLAPEDAQTYVFDCLLLCDEIRRQAVAKL
jgi:hypothetical protein